MNVRESESQSRIVALFNRVIGPALRSEIIGGVSVADARKFVDLDVKFSPVVERLCGRYIPEPVRVENWGDGRYAIVRPRVPDFDIVSAESVRDMRARFLLLRDHYARVWEEIPHSASITIADWYFNGVAPLHLVGARLGGK